ncbi:MAG: helix-turn-helix transcriptional regulator [Flavipsychrobacter sp.]|nr:helix-turn-helix transcriptional regulator [Flavipsychrobacter sp.]
MNEKKPLSVLETGKMDIEKRYTVEIEEFGKRLRALRERQQLSQLDLELKSGINRTEISRIENGQKNIEFFTIVKLATALDTTLSQLFAVV